MREPHVRFPKTTEILESPEKEPPIRRAQVGKIDRPSSSPIRRWRQLGLLCLWVAFIFGTSCTVIRPTEFFELVARFTGAGRESMERFAVFWGVSWFAIVKGWHFTEFVVLTFFTASAIKWWRNELTVRSIIGAMLFCLAFAASDEWHQSFIPDRFGTVQDVVIDSLGVFAAGWVLLSQVRSGKG